MHMFCYLYRQILFIENCMNDDDETGRNPYLTFFFELQNVSYFLWILLLSLISWIYYHPDAYVGVYILLTFGLKGKNVFIGVYSLKLHFFVRLEQGQKIQDFEKYRYPYIFNGIFTHVICIDLDYSFSLHSVRFHLWRWCHYYTLLTTQETISC